VWVACREVVVRCFEQLWSDGSNPELGGCSGDQCILCALGRRALVSDCEWKCVAAVWLWRVASVFHLSFVDLSTLEVALGSRAELPGFRQFQLDVLGVAAGGGGGGCKNRWHQPLGGEGLGGVV